MVLNNTSGNGLQVGTAGADGMYVDSAAASIGIALEGLEAGDEVPPSGAPE